MALPHPLPAEYARTVADRFRLLGDPTRLMLMDLLRDGERSVGTLAADLGCTQANASKHLGLLADGGLLIRRREGLHCFYRVADESVFELCDSVCASVLSHLDARVDALRAAATSGS
ncbi:MAG TPA: metalloregulator ArsR/SmtB family transcription factor [Gaiellales bacterium]|nr:metalloregulator ArsR/SmtB family transcription factor [Gaiellales bacterium]